MDYIADHAVGLQEDSLGLEMCQVAYEELTYFLQSLEKREAFLTKDNGVGDVDPFASIVSDQTLAEYTHLTRHLPSHITSLESVGDKAVNLIQTVIKAVYKVVSYLAGWVSKIWTRYVSEAASLRRHSERMAKQSTELGDAVFKSPSVQVYEHLLVRDGDSLSGEEIQAGVQEVVGYTKNLLGKSKKDTRDLAKAQKKMLKGLVKSKDNVSTGALLDGYRALHPKMNALVSTWGLSTTGDLQREVFQKYGLDGSDIPTLTTKRLMGDRVVFAILPSPGSIRDADSAIWWANLTTAGVYTQNPVTKPKRSQVETLLPSNITQIAMACSVLLDDVISHKQSATDSERFLSDISDQIKKIQDSTSQSGDLSAQDQKQMVAGISVTKSVSRYHSRISADFATYVMELVRVLLDYCQASLKQYN